MSNSMKKLNLACESLFQLFYIYSYNMPTDVGKLSDKILKICTRIIGWPSLCFEDISMGPVQHLNTLLVLPARCLRNMAPQIQETVN